MNIYLPIIAFIVVVAIMLYILSCMRNEGVPIASVIYHGPMTKYKRRSRSAAPAQSYSGPIDPKILTEPIKSMSLLKTGIYYTFLSKFGKDRWSHWAVLCETDNSEKLDKLDKINDMSDIVSHKFILSPTGHGSIHVYDVTGFSIDEQTNSQTDPSSNSKKNTIRLLTPGKSEHIYTNSLKPYKDRTGRWLIYQTYTPIYKMTVQQAINRFYDMNRHIRYGMITTNCQFSSQLFLHKYTNAEFPETDPGKLFSHIVTDAFSNMKIAH